MPGMNMTLNEVNLDLYPSCLSFDPAYCQCSGRQQVVAGVLGPHHPSWEMEFMVTDLNLVQLWVFQTFGKWKNGKKISLSTLLSHE